MEETKKAYISLDSRYAKFTDRGGLSWGLEEIPRENTFTNAAFGKIFNDNDGLAIAGKSIRNVISCKIASFLICGFAGNSYRRVRVQIEELRGQAFISGNIRYHFEGFGVTMAQSKHYVGRRLVRPITFPDGSYMYPEPLYPILHDKVEVFFGPNSVSEYKFNEPITIMDNVSLRFYNPLEEISVRRYSHVAEFISFDNAFGNYLDLRLANPHGFATGTNSIYSVFFSNVRFTKPSNQAAADVFSREMNNEFEATYIDVLNDRDIRIHFTTANLRSVPTYQTLSENVLIQTVASTATSGSVTYTNLDLPQPNCVVYITGYRMIINLEVEYSG
jgi:hypothetical protein